MGSRRPNPRLAKIHRNYTVEEIASLFGVHRNTVREWLKRGLPISDKKRPILILGRDLMVFLQARRVKNRCHCQPGQLYCVRCRAPKIPAAGMTEYKPITARFGNLIAICPDCNSIMNRRTSASMLAQIKPPMDIMMPQAGQHIGESVKSSVNCDLQPGAPDHDKS